MLSAIISFDRPKYGAEIAKSSKEAIYMPVFLTAIATWTFD
jgi:hypothetical protein